MRKQKNFIKKGGSSVSHCEIWQKRNNFDKFPLQLNWYQPRSLFVLFIVILRPWEWRNIANLTFWNRITLWWNGGNIELICHLEAESLYDVQGGISVSPCENASFLTNSFLIYNDISQDTNLHSSLLYLHHCNNKTLS